MGPVEGVCHLFVFVFRWYKVLPNIGNLREIAFIRLQLLRLTSLPLKLILPWGRARGNNGRLHAAPAAVNACLGNEQPLRCDVFNKADAWRRLFCLQIYNEKKSQFEIKRNNPKDLVERVARDISKLLNNKRKALEVRRAA